MGIGDMAISANGRTHDIQDRIGHHPAPDITVHYSEDHLPRGAAGCIKDCEEWLGNETFVVVNGACLLVDVDLQHLLDEHRRNDAIVTVGASAEESSDEEGSAVALKPTGIYICEPEVFGYIRSRGYQDMKEQLIPRLVAAGKKVQAVAIRGRVIPIRNEEAYLNAMVEVLEDSDAREFLAHHLSSKVPSVWIDPTATVDPTARIVGPAYIGAGAKLMADSVVIGPAIVGPDCVIEQDAIVNESIIWRGAHVGVGALVEQTVMAAESVVGAGSEVRGSIVLETSLSAAERQSLSGSMDFAPAEEARLRRIWRRLWNAFRPAARPAV
jgi:mannose-1-phosphate guanylyltransferase/phosphomannomutase